MVASMAMPNPYRTPATPTDADAVVEEDRDDHILAGLLVALGGVRVVLTFAAGEPFGTEPTLAAIMMFLGVLLALATFVRR